MSWNWSWKRTGASSPGCNLERHLQIGCHAHLDTHRFPMFQCVEPIYCTLFFIRSLAVMESRQTQTCECIRNSMCYSLNKRSPSETTTPTSLDRVFIASWDHQLANEPLYCNTTMQIRGPNRAFRGNRKWSNDLREAAIENHGRKLTILGIGSKRAYQSTLVTQVHLESRLFASCCGLVDTREPSDRDISRRFSHPHDSVGHFSARAVQLCIFAF